jgi:hypothetical protein
MGQVSGLPTSVPAGASLVAQTAPPSAPPVEPDPSLVTPGLFGLVIVLALGVSIAFLYRSMNRQLKKVEFDDAPPSGGGAEGSDGDGRPR